MKRNPASVEPSLEQETKETQHRQSSHISTDETKSLCPKSYYNHHRQETEVKNDVQVQCIDSNNQETAKELDLEKPLMGDDSGRERLKKHRTEVAGSVWIPEIWGQEQLLKDWIDCSAFDASLMSSRIMSARSALVEEGRRAATGRLRIENRCLI